MLRESQVDAILAASRAELEDLESDLDRAVVPIVEVTDIARGVREALLALLEMSPPSKRRDIQVLIGRYGTLINGCAN